MCNTVLVSLALQYVFKGMKRFNDVNEHSDILSQNAKKMPCKAEKHSESKEYV